jgi:hypothetical protein
MLSVTDVQHRFVCKVAIDEAMGDRADLAPARLDRDLGLSRPAMISAASGARPMPPRSTLIYPW